MTEIVLFTPEQREIVSSQLQLQRERKSAPVWPTTSRIVSQGVTPTHRAIDIPGNVGDPIYSPMAGKVTDVRPNQRGYGLNLRILLESGQEIIMAHLSGVSVRPGQLVGRGQVVGALGASGESPGRPPLAPHLHFEIRDPGPDRFEPGFTSTTTALDPYVFFGKSPESRSSYENKSAGITPETLRRDWIAPAKDETGGLELQSTYENKSARVTPESLSRTRLPAAKSKTEAPDSEGTKVLEMGVLGDVTIEPQPWWDIAAVGVGVIGLFLGITMIVKPSPERIISKVLPAVKAVAAVA